MGCDIHFHSEVKIGSVWHHHSQATIERKYALFAKMAGVRNWTDSGIIPICKPKGIPEDATFLTKLDVERYGEDGHNHSWLGANEISELYKWIENLQSSFGISNGRLFRRNNFPYFMGNNFDSFIEYPQDWKEYEVEDIRFVFFFDN